MAGSADGHARPVEGGLQHDEGLGAELVEPAVAVHPGAQVELGDGLGAGDLGDVDEHGQVDAVAPHERQLLEQRPAAGVLAGQRLA